MSAVVRRSPARTAAVAGLALLLAAGLHLLAAPAASATPYCGQVWGSQPEVVGSAPGGQLRAVRTGRHECFDRIVLDAVHFVSSYSVQYVDVVTEQGTGAAVPVRGGARLAIVPNVGHALWPTPATGASMADVGGYRTFRDVVWAGSSDRVTTIGLGVRARLPFRTFLLPGPGNGNRLVVDVAHQWCDTGTTC